MRQQYRLFYLTLLAVAMFGLTITGCGTQQEQPSKQQEQPQAAAPAGTQPGPAGTPTGGAGAATEAAKKATAEKETAPSAPLLPRQATLPAGTKIAIVTSSALSTKTNKSGEVFQASLAQDIVAGDWVIAKKGAPVSGVIVNSDPGGKVKGVASISLQLKKITLDDAQAIPISTSTYSVNAKPSKKKDAAKVGIGAGVGAAIGAIAGGGKGAAIGAGVGGGAGTGAVLMTRGEPATIRSEALITFKLTVPVEVTEKK
jgi:hypothetical protein